MPLSRLAFAACLLAAALTWAQPLRPDRRLRPSTDQDHLPPPPIELVGGESVDLGKVYKLTQVPFIITVRNTSDKPLPYERIILNCNCTNTYIPPKGEIPPGAEFKIPMRLDATQLREKNAFTRIFRFEFKEYRPFIVNFHGELSREIYATPADKPEQAFLTSINFGQREHAYEDFTFAVDIKGQFHNAQTIDLGKPEIPNRKFQASLEKISDTHWRVTLKPVLPLQFGVNADSLIIPVNQPSPGTFISLPLNMLVGTMLEPSADDIYIDPLTEKGIVKKTFALTRVAFRDRATMAALFMGKKNPYNFTPKILQASEVQLPQADGAEFSLEQGKGGVYVHCQIDCSKIPAEGGLTASFNVPGSKSTQVTFALLTDEIRQTLKEQEEAMKAAKADNDENEEIPIPANLKRRTPPKQPVQPKP